MKTVLLELEVPDKCRDPLAELAEILAQRDADYIEGFLEELLVNSTKPSGKSA